MEAHQNLIVGAGVTGIALAKRLNDRGRDFLVIEKSKSAGGRLATRRDQNAKFDHGAQFFKYENQSFGLAGFWSKRNLLQPWFEDAGAKHSCSKLGMNSLIKTAAEGFSDRLRLNTRLHKLKPEADGYYSVDLEAAVPVKAKKIFLTCPLPQALKILDDSSILYPRELEDITYAPALVGLFVMKRELLTAEACRQLEAFKFRDQISDSIFSISNQHSKGLCEDLAYTVVMSGHWSALNFESDESAVSKEIAAHFLDWLGQNLEAPVSQFIIDRQQLKKWRYSQPLVRSKGLHLAIRPGLILLGDAFGGGSINGALRSADSIELD